MVGRAERRLIAAARRPAGRSTRVPSARRCAATDRACCTRTSGIGLARRGPGRALPPGPRRHLLRPRRDHVPKALAGVARALRRLFAAADLVLCEGPTCVVLVALGCPEAKVRVQPLGVETRSPRVRARRRATDGLVRILIAGAFREKKGMPLALEPPSPVCASVTRAAGDRHRRASGLRPRRPKSAASRRGADRGCPTWSRCSASRPTRISSRRCRHDIFLSPSIVARRRRLRRAAPRSRSPRWPPPACPGGERRTATSRRSSTTA